MRNLKKALSVSAAALSIVAAGAASASADVAGAKGAAANSPGILSGDVIEAPIAIPVDICGNTTNIGLGLLNPAAGNACINN